MEEVIGKFRGDLDIQIERSWVGSSLGAFRISYIGREPTTLAAVVNHLANLYVQENIRSRESQAEGTSQFIDNQLLESKRRLDELETSVSRYKVQHNGELPQQENSLSGTLNRLQVQLQGIQDALNRGQQNLVTTQNMLHLAETEEALSAAPAKGDAAVSSGSAGGGSVDDRTVRRSAEIRVQLEAMRARYSEEYPDVQQLKQQLARALEEERVAAREQAKRLAARVALTGGANPAMADLPPQASPEQLRARQRTIELKAQLQLTRQEIATKTAERQEVLAAIADYQKRIESLPIREQEMSSLTRDYEMTKANYRSLLDKKMSAEMATDMERHQKAERFTIVNPAKAPARPFKPKRQLLAMAGGVISLLLALSLVIAKGFHENLILGEWELGEHAPIIGRVPRITYPKNGRKHVMANRARYVQEGIQSSFTVLTVVSLAASLLRTMRL